MLLNFIHLSFQTKQAPSADKRSAKQFPNFLSLIIANPHSFTIHKRFQESRGDTGHLNSLHIPVIISSP